MNASHTWLLSLRFIHQLMSRNIFHKLSKQKLSPPKTNLSVKITLQSTQYKHRYKAAQFRFSFSRKINESQALLVLTNANGCQKFCDRFRRITIVEKRFQQVYTESESYYSLRTRSHYHTFDPQSDEGQKWAKSFFNIGVISTSFRYHAS